jgi:hypothetical protein
MSLSLFKQVTIGPAAPSHLPSVDGVAALLVWRGGPGLGGPNKKDECFAADEAELEGRNGKGSPSACKGIRDGNYTERLS